MVELEENHSSYTTMKDHFKKRFPGLGCRHVQDVAFYDLFQTTGDVGASKRGYKYYLLISLNRAETVHGFGLKTKDAAPAALKQFFVDVCVPELVVTYGGGELTGRPWRETLRTFHTRGVLEPRHQNQNFAERNVQIVKEMSHRVMNRGLPKALMFCSRLRHGCMEPPSKPEKLLENAN